MTEATEIEEALSGLPAPNSSDEDVADAIVAKIEAAQDDSAVVEKQPSGTDEGHSEAEKEPAKPDLPPIEPPTSWNANAKKAFSEIPRHLQETIVEREKERESYFGRHTNEIAESRKVVEAERARITEERQKALQTFDTALHAVITSDPIIAEGRTIDWPRLAATDPGTYAAKKAIFDDRVSKVNQAIQQRQAFAQQTFEESNRQQQAFLAEQAKLIQDKVPEWRENPDKMHTETREIVTHARSRYGISEQELNAVGDHRAILILRDNARMARENADLQAELSKLKAGAAKTLKEIEPKKAPAPVPKVATARAANESARPLSERAKASMQQARRTGKIHDGVDAVIAALSR